MKEVTVAPGGHGDGDDGARTQRFVVCHNPEQADRDAAVRQQLVAHLESLIAGSDSWSDRRRDDVHPTSADPALDEHVSDRLAARRVRATGGDNVEVDLEQGLDVRRVGVDDTERLGVRCGDAPS